MLNEEGKLLLSLVNSLAIYAISKIQTDSDVETGSLTRISANQHKIKQATNIYTTSIIPTFGVIAVQKPKRKHDFQTNVTHQPFFTQFS